MKKNTFSLLLGLVIILVLLLGLFSYNRYRALLNNINSISANQSTPLAINGNDGADGVDGTSGNDGADGVDGAAGPTGPVGPAGTPEWPDGWPTSWPDGWPDTWPSDWPVGWPDDWPAGGWPVVAASGTAPLTLGFNAGVLEGSITQADGGTDGYLSAADWTTLMAKQDALSFTASDFNLAGTTLSIDYANGQAASASAKGFLTAADWSTFNSKQSALSFNVNDFDVAGSAVSIDYTNGQTATALAKGFLTASDWSTFNGKQDSLTLGDVTAGTNKISIGGTGTGAVIGAGLSIDVVEANIVHNNLGGLTTGDAHTQYAYLAGRSGGQTLSGGTDANDDITIQGTTNGTRDTSSVNLQPNGGNVGIGVLDAAHLFEVKSGISIESAPLGSEVIDGTGWTSTGWTGNFATGFTHTAGNTSSLSRAVPGTGTDFYQVTFTVDIALASGKLTVTLGNSTAYDLYNGSGAGATYTAGIRSVSDGNLVFTPATDFTGTITNISVKQITGVYASTMALLDNSDGVNFEIRSSTSSLHNTFVGVDSGSYNTTGYENSSVGNNALAWNTSGYWNSAIGYKALRSNSTGSRNIAVGANALISNVSGQRNIGIGTFSLPQNTSGNYNVSVGADSLFVNTTGTGNVALGFSALGSNTTGNYSVSLGHLSGLAATGSNNIFLGFSAGRYETGSNTLIIDSLSRSSEATSRSEALVYGTTNATATDQILSLGGGGNVGIGTIIPNTKLDVYNSSTTASDIDIALFRRQRIAADGWAGLYIRGDGNPVTTGTIKLVATGTNTQSLSMGPTGSELYIQRATGNVGIGTVSPTATLHLRAGTATANSAPLKLTTGTLLGTAEAGAIEFVTDTFYMTATNGTTTTKRQAIPGVTVGTATPVGAVVPLRVGDIYVDTVNDKVYIATGTAVSGDWTPMN